MNPTVEMIAGLQISLQSVYTGIDTVDNAAVILERQNTTVPGIILLGSIQHDSNLWSLPTLLSPRLMPHRGIRHQWRRSPLWKVGPVETMI